MKWIAAAWMAAVWLAASAGSADLGFLPAARCADAADVDQCKAARPKEWTADEIQAIRSTLQRLQRHELVPGILAGALANGYRGLQRYGTDTQRDADGSYETKFGPGFVLFDANVIGITDAFFDLAEVRDPIGGYRVGDLVLLHELIHAFDDRRQSHLSDFVALTGWTRENGRWQYKNRVSLSGYNGIYADTLTMYARGRYEEAWARDRRFATALAVPVPRIQSLVDPGESFADILSHLILDPTARDYLPAPVVAWVEGVVFPGLRTKAPAGALTGGDQ